MGNSIVSMGDIVFLALIIHQHSSTDQPVPPVDTSDDRFLTLRGVVGSPLQPDTQSLE